MCSYLTYNPDYLEIGESVQVLWLNSDFIYKYISYNGRPFVLTFPENTIVESVKRIKASSGNNLITLRVTDPDFERVCKLICSQILGDDNNPCKGLEFKSYQFFIRQKGNIIHPGRRCC